MTFQCSPLAARGCREGDTPRHATPAPLFSSFSLNLEIPDGAFLVCGRARPQAGSQTLEPHGQTPVTPTTPAVPCACLPHLPLVTTGLVYVLLLRKLS
ncbi:hypothetical protein E2C01_025595 [Portunus trituberculatus]|uniref:Uncharacterized protein n=1 Tax=Portunus trituberculatus TaxID=210409 RepID=A0A5B7EGC4_PORTR|nr:hypothetical protein [Portunus trituberculatus]